MDGEGSARGAAAGSTDMGEVPDEHAPRHVAVARELERRIASGRYPAGDRFPTERELQAEFRVGRYSVREALKILTEHGLIGRRRKTGSVVLSREPVSRYVHSVRDIRSLVDFAQTTTLDIRARALVTLAKPELHGFAEEAGSRWLRIAGLRSSRASGRPLCWSEICVAEPYAPLRESIRPHGKAVYEVAMEQHDLRLDRVEQVVEASSVPPQVAETLEAEALAPALMVRRRYFAAPDRSFEITHNLFPADLHAVHSIFRQRL